jgi:hypothetical protein
MAVPPEFLIKLEKSTAGSTFGCSPATGCRRFRVCRPNTSVPSTSRQLAAGVPAVYLAHAFLAIVAILEVHEMNNLRVCSRLSVSDSPRLASGDLASAQPELASRHCLERGLASLWAPLARSGASKYVTRGSLQRSQALRYPMHRA